MVESPKMASINTFIPWWGKSFFHKEKGPISQERVVEGCPTSLRPSY